MTMDKWFRVLASRVSLLHPTPAVLCELRVFCASALRSFRSRGDTAPATSSSLKTGKDAVRRARS